VGLRTSYMEALKDLVRRERVPLRALLKRVCIGIMQCPGSARIYDVKMMRLWDWHDWTLEAIGDKLCNGCNCHVPTFTRCWRILRAASLLDLQVARRANLLFNWYTADKTVYTRQDKSETKLSLTEATLTCL